MIAIIPARGGSKGLPGKNVRPLLGKPLIAYTIECAKAAQSIDRVVVSTDDPKIAEIAQEFGAEVPFLRPAELATDTAKAIDNYIYTVDRLSREDNIAIDAFIVLLPTSPLRKSQDINCAVDMFLERNADSVISYTPETHPISWHKYLNTDCAFEDIFKDSLANRQELRVSYYPNGAIYVFRSAMIREGRYYTDKSYAYVMPRNRSVDIDSVEDFEYAEYLLSKGNAVVESASR